jgi:hypothetical protein
MQQGSHPAQIVRQAQGSMLNSAGGVVGSGDYLVTALGTPSMNVNVAGGVPGGEAWLDRTGNLAAGLYFAYNDATVDLPIAASNPTNGRIDVPILQAEDSYYGDATTVCQLAVVQGTPAASPVVPSVPASAMPLANVAVPANASTIVTGNITDERVFALAALATGPWVNITSLGTNVTAYTPAPQIRFVNGGRSIQGNGALTVSSGGVGAYGSTFFTVPAWALPTSANTYAFLTSSVGAAIPVFINTSTGAVQNESGVTVASASVYLSPFYYPQS